MEKGTLITMNLMSTKNFQDESLAKQIIEIIGRYPRFVPEIYDYEEPLKKVFDIGEMEEMVDTWMNFERNKLVINKEFASGYFITRRKKNIKTINDQIHFQ